MGGIYLLIYSFFFQSETFDSSWFIFVEYVHLCAMQENYPSLSAAVAGDRKFDVYMGIDVFGRGTYGGGQWNVCTFLTTYLYVIISLLFIHIDLQVGNFSCG